MSASFPAGLVTLTGSHVATVELLDRVREEGCDYAQGEAFDAAQRES